MDNKLMGFLSPKGEFYECNFFEHSKLAEKLLLQLNTNEIIANPEVQLANLGWMSFQQNFAGIVAEIRPIPALTDEQVNWILNNYEKINRKQRYFISEKLKFDEVYKKRKLPKGIDNVPFGGII